MTPRQRELESRGYIALGRGKVVRPGSIMYYLLGTLEMLALLAIPAVTLGLLWIVG